MKEATNTDGDDVVCEHCGSEIDPDEALTATFPGLPDLYRCPNCAECTEGPPPE